MSTKAICLDTAIPEVREVLTELDEYLRGEIAAPDPEHMKSMLTNMIDRLEQEKEVTVKVKIESDRGVESEEELRVRRDEIDELCNYVASRLMEY